MSEQTVRQQTVRQLKGMCSECGKIVRVGRTTGNVCSHSNPNVVVGEGHVRVCLGTGHPPVTEDDTDGKVQPL